MIREFTTTIKNDNNAQQHRELLNERTNPTQLSEDKDRKTSTEATQSASPAASTDNDSAMPSAVGKENVADTPKGLPQCFPCQLPNIYIRDCYHEYYDYVLQSMAEVKHYIVVTGTPGIGKSVFYLHFFEKYKAENPDKTIVAASYSKSRKLEGCKIWDPKSKKLETQKHLPTLEDEEAVYLIDGIPDAMPHESNFAIMFTSPDIDFFVYMNKYGTLYREMYMPNWTVKEIWEAIAALGLKVSPEDLNERWKYFGSAPRFLFESDQEAVQRGILNVQTAVNTLHSVEDVFACFDGSADPKKVLHRLMHYDVKQMRGVFNRTLKMASKYIAYAVQERLNKKLEVDRQSLMSWLDGTSKSAAFLGWLFEGYAHEKILEGIDLPLRGLNPQATEKSITIAQTNGEYTKFRMADLEQIFEEAYRQPGSSTLRSVDSYYMTKTGILWLFQMTRNVNHQINVEGILELLEKLGKLEDTRNVNLVFVVPKNVGENFPVQTFKQIDVYVPNVSDEVLRALDVDKIPKIKDYKKRKLNEVGITNIGQLLDAKDQDPNRVSLVQNALAEFETNRRRHQHLQAVLDLKQYCLVLDYALPDATGWGPL